MTTRSRPVARNASWTFGESGIRAVLRRDDAGVFEAVAVHAEDAHERRLEREVDAGLHLGRAHELARFRRAVWRFAGRAEVLEKCVECHRLSVRRYHAVVVAGDREDRRGVVAIGLVELVVIILGLAEAVDDVAQVIEERRDGLGVDVRVVAYHLVGDQYHVLRAFRVARVANDVEHDLACALNCGRD